MNEQNVNGYGMKWYNFLKTAMLVVAIVGAIGAILAESVVIIAAILKFSEFGFFGCVWEIIKYTLLILVLVASVPYFAWFASKNLKAFKVEAPGNVYLVLIWSTILYIINGVLAYVRGDIAIASIWSLVFAIDAIIMFVIIALNYIYFEKRAHLFCKE